MTTVYNVTTSNRFALLEIPEKTVSVTPKVQPTKTPTPTYTPPTLKKRLYAPPTEELSFAMGLWRFTLLAIVTLSSFGKVDAAPCNNALIPGGYRPGSLAIPTFDLPGKEVIRKKITATYEDTSNGGYKSISMRTRDRLNVALNGELNNLPVLASSKVDIDTVDGREMLSVAASDMAHPIMRGTLESGQEFVAIKVEAVATKEVSTQVFYEPKCNSKYCTYEYNGYDTWNTSPGPICEEGGLGINQITTLAQLFHGYDVNGVYKKYHYDSDGSFTICSRYRLSC